MVSERRLATLIKKELLIEEPIKILGNHFVYVNLGYDLKAKIKIKVLALDK